MSRDLPIKAVLWPIVGKNDAGEPLVGAPVEIDSRWELKRGQTVNNTGQLTYTDGIVWVEQMIDEGSILWKGKIKHWKDTGSQPLMRVEFYEEIGDLDDREHERTVHVVKFMGKLPQQAP